MDPLLRWIVIGVALIGSPFAMIGGWEAYETHTQLGAFGHATGHVVGNRLTTTQRDGLEEHAYQPEVTFDGADRASHRFTDGVGSLPADYAIGDAVEVLYDPAGIAPARIASWKRLWLVPSILIAVGLLPGLVVGIVVLRIGRNTRATEAMPPR